MTSYRLDDLGWAQFEDLMQAVLKAKFSAGIEAWGGTKDWGRDAYYENSIEFPDPKNVAPPPILFQMKFVKNANAAGAKPRKSLLDALGAEARQWRRGSKSPMNTYVLLTNAPLTAKLRTDLCERITTNFKPSHAYVFGYQDVCAWLESEPGLVRSFPQILSLKNLEVLIASSVEKHVQKALAKPIIERSLLAVEQAKEIARVFVPTSAYEETRRKLDAFSFVVLEGPPEVGKTAIARMIMLEKVTEGWSPCECRDPDQFFQFYDSRSPQLFVADDAFGRTEYDPSATKRWIRDLEGVIGRLGPQHWLIWTARKHIVEMAFKRADMQGVAENFPKPGAVFVGIGDLRQKEKCDMLYRHAKAGGLGPAAAFVVKKSSSFVIEMPNVTPERIRRFISNNVRDIARSLDLNGGEESIEVDQGRLNFLVFRSLSDPTTGMLRSYQALPSSYRTLLVAMLDEMPSRAKSEVPYPPEYFRLGIEESELREGYRRHWDRERMDLAEMLTDLSQAFIRISRYRGKDWVDWIHPSLRDLVIDQVADSNTARLRFLKNSSAAGIRLALSVGGGAVGARSLPFLKNSSDCEQLARRASSVIPTLPHKECLSYFESLREAVLVRDAERELAKSIVEGALLVIESCRVTWDTLGEPIDLALLEAVCELREHIAVDFDIPNLAPTWEYTIHLFRSEATEWKRQKEDNWDSGEFIQWVGFRELGHFVELTTKYQPEFLDCVDWPGCLLPGLEVIPEALGYYLEDEVLGYNHDYRGDYNLQWLREANRAMKFCAQAKAPGLGKAFERLRIQLAGRLAEFESDCEGLHEPSFDIEESKRPVLISDSGPEIWSVARVESVFDDL